MHDHNMARRVFGITSCASAALLLISVTLFIAGHWLTAHHYHPSINDHFHIGVLSGRGEGMLVFFSDADYGPYRGSIIDLNNSVTGTYGDGPGYYYRSFSKAGTPLLWTLMVSLWYAIIPASILPTIYSLLWLRRRHTSSSDDDSITTPTATPASDPQTPC